ncbi:tripartite tricarboxylate transporter TctB family protein [Saccharopolyspora elongata]|uniref:Tripartite tricarboxylate transporter TctB family protein n=1 Tax=Saccharopolyspora elongata TaxID=2530387 RepID=A0A4R4XQJ0_9PSEU|nr:tripartite tricarboxylate transporter TctB family protein [Saccharopolyspora elongata]TDD33139.1 tripartite tricarboxylate transporter TctB family protein [Saccharopolyspora elongata]
MSGQRSPQVAVFGGLALVGAGFAVSAVGYGVMLPESRIGPGFLPLVAGGLLAVFSVLLLVEQLRRPAAPEGGTDDFGRTPAQRMWILRRVFALLPAALLAVPLVGMVTAFGLLVLVISTWLERRKVLPALALSAVSAAAMHVIFAVVLRVPLPTGLFGF